jgi:hypothetical protein
MLSNCLRVLLVGNLVGATSSPLRAQGLPEQQPEQARPPGLVILERRTVPYGQQVTGIYAVRPAADIADGKRLKVWEEKVNDVKVRNETLLCGVASPARITSSGSQLVMLELNPGGAIGPHNKLSHLIWWAGCYPEQGGKDPAELMPLARKLGFSGIIQEREHLLPGNPR